MFGLRKKKVVAVSTDDFPDAKNVVDEFDFQITGSELQDLIILATHAEFKDMQQYATFGEVIAKCKAMVNLCHEGCLVHISLYQEVGSE